MDFRSSRHSKNRRCEARNAASPFDEARVLEVSALVRAVSFSGLLSRTFLLRWHVGRLLDTIQIQSKLLCSALLYPCNCHKVSKRRGATRFSKLCGIFTFVTLARNGAVSGDKTWSNFQRDCHRSWFERLA